MLRSRTRMRMASTRVRERTIYRAQLMGWWGMTVLKMSEKHSSSLERIKDVWERKY